MSAIRRNIVPAAMIAATLALSACASHPAAPDHPASAASTIDWTAAKTVTVKLSDFSFTPNDVTFTSGQPTRLVLVDDGSGHHDFSSPAFFSAAAFRQGSAMPVNGKIVVAQGQSAEIDLVPGAPGHYPLECTEFLHTIFGMTGSITVAQ